MYDTGYHRRPCIMCGELIAVRKGLVAECAFCAALWRLGRNQRKEEAEADSKAEQSGPEVSL